MIISPLSFPDDEMSLYADVSMKGNNFQSLDDIMINAFSRAALVTEAERASVLSSLQQAQITNDPAELFKLQQRTANYNLQVSTISALTRKGVSTIETLLRS